MPHYVNGVFVGIQNEQGHVSLCWQYIMIIGTAQVRWADHAIEHPTWQVRWYNINSVVYKPVYILHEDTDVRGKTNIHPHPMGSLTEVTESWAYLHISPVVKWSGSNPGTTTPRFERDPISRQCPPTGLTTILKCNLNIGDHFGPRFCEFCTLLVHELLIICYGMGKKCTPICQLGQFALYCAFVGQLVIKMVSSR